MRVRQRHRIGRHDALTGLTFATKRKTKTKKLDHLINICKSQIHDTSLGIRQQLVETPHDGTSANETQRQMVENLRGHIALRVIVFLVPRRIQSGATEALRCRRLTCSR